MKRNILLSFIILLSLFININTTSAALTIGALTVASDGALTLTGAVGSAINLGTTATTGNIAIGTALTSGTITIGSATATGDVNIYGGLTGGNNYLFNNSTTSNVYIATDLTTGGLSVGDRDMTGAVTIHGSKTGGTNGLFPSVTTSAINIGTGLTSGVLTIGGSTATGAMTFGSSSGAQTVNIGTGAGVSTVNIGTSGAAGSSIQIGGTSGGLQYYEQIETMTGDDTLTVAESGKTFYMCTAGVDITLPVATAGVWYKFTVCSSSFATTSMTILTSSSQNKINSVLNVNNTLAAVSSGDTITFLHSAETPGDTITMRSDGSNWFVTGTGFAASSIVVTQASA